MIAARLRSVLKAAQPGQFFGWWVVAGCFVMASTCWGLAFYGNGLYMAHLVKDKGWPIFQVSSAFSVFFWIGAIFIVATGRWVDRIGPQVSAAFGTISMTLAVLLIAQVSALWQLYGALVFLALGWAWMSGAAINATVARWFDRRRGAALSIALTGASMGGIFVVPLMVVAIERLGFERGVSAVALVLGLLVLAVVRLTFVREPSQLDQSLDAATPIGQPRSLVLPLGQAGDQSLDLAHDQTSGPSKADTAALTLERGMSIEPWPIGRLIRMRAFVSNVIPFAVGLLAQAGFLTHQITMLEEQYSRATAALAVVITTFSAIAGRLWAGYYVDRVSRRLIAALNFAIQVFGLLLFAFGREPLSLYLGCVLFGIGVGNMIAFSGLLIQREFPREQFAHVTRWATAITQATYAVGPALLGLLRQSTGSYFWCLILCATIGVISSLVVWFGRPTEPLASA